MTVRTFVLALAILATVVAAPTSAQEFAPTTIAPVVRLQQAAQQAPLRTPDVIFVPTPQEVVDAMLRLAKVTKNDVVYDLGSGDGRIPITAAKTYGARAVGIDIDPVRITEAMANLKTNSASDPTLSKRVTFLNQDLFTTDISEATVVTLYLLPSLNVKLIPKLNKELKPGTRIVSHAFDMSADGVERKPITTENINGRTIYYWTIPIQPASQ
jgi:SAM-dependent methyltransferase